ncbi:hypothetical protein VMCG_02145 [Cytospora schulzeri]|uniref:Protein kinase domain-containing protein n=1 Tax=Cytospora schulzeri TaxID=448051 RepID=A0A423X3K9_9PEZI|nr:hypothetical protein VMCG_02145 [Valsa malicola]
MAPSKKTLSSELFKACSESRFPPSENPKRFLPHGKLDQIVTRESVIRELDWDQDDDALIDFILKDAKTLFAISLMSRIPDLRPTMELFMKHNICDRDLPLPISRDQVSKDLGECFEFVEDMDLDLFINKQQWMFLAPVFGVGPASAIEIGQRSFPQGVIFPFVKTEEIIDGGFGIVYKVEIHKSHLHGSPDDPILKDNCKAAIKELRLQINMDETDSKAYKVWKRETAALEMISHFRNPHIIEAQAIMSRGGKQYIMFPWADGGNLWDFWSRNPSPILTVDFIRDIVEQLAGLADALKLLHDYNWRHGDLKPENILVFTPEERQGVWKMADLALTKFNKVSTQQRLYTTTINGTISYEPPDVLNRVGPRSRLYDIWSMGCIILQLVIWLLRGLDTCTEFMRSIFDPQKGTSSFWVQMSEPRVHPMVTRMMDGISEHLENVTKSPAIEALLNIVRNQLLVVQLPSRANAAAFHSALKEIQQKGEANRAYWLTGPINSEDAPKPEAHSLMVSQVEARVL